MTEDEIVEDPKCPRCGGTNLKIKAKTVTSALGRKVFRTLYCRDCEYYKALL